jgi:hypothetical protein
MVQIKIAPITAALLAGTAAAAYAQVGMAQTPGNVAPGDLGQLNRLNPNSGSPATGGYGTLGAGDRQSATGPARIPASTASRPAVTPSSGRATAAACSGLERESKRPA